MRVTHRLKPNAEQSTPSLRIFLDCECSTKKQADGSQLQTLRFGWMLRERRTRSHGRIRTVVTWHRFATADEAWELFERIALKGALCWVFAHNFDYDGAMIAMESQAAKRGWACTRWAKAKHFLFARFAKGTKALLFTDTLNYWQGSVEALGEALSTPKLAVPPKDASAAEWDAYCRQDVSILATFMHGLFDLCAEQGWGRFKPTLAGVSWHAYRHKFMSTPPLVIADDDLSAFERKAYHGGRTECFTLARQGHPVYQVDVNSMYPSVMRDNPYPVAKVRGHRAATLDEYRDFRKRFLAIAECHISTDEPAYAVKHDGRLVFPVGEFVTTLCTPEIDYALAHGHLASINRAVLYTPADLFSGYVNSLHALRQQYARNLNRPLELACKLLLNSLYGKFGQLALRWERCPLDYDEPDASFLFACQRGGIALRHVVRWGEVWHQIRGGESQDSIPSIAAHVTAYARVKLWHLIGVAGRENVYYCDTDSLFVNQAGVHRLGYLLSPYELGKLKIAGRYEWAHFRGPKDYATSAGEKIKGVRHNALKLKDGQYNQERFTSYDQMLKNGVDGAVHVTTELKHLERLYIKGVAAPDGAIAPLRLPLSQ